MLSSFPSPSFFCLLLECAGKGSGERFAVSARSGLPAMGLENEAGKNWRTKSVGTAAALRRKLDATEDEETVYPCLKGNAEAGSTLLWSPQELGMGNATLRPCKLLRSFSTIFNNGLCRGAGDEDELFEENSALVASADSRATITLLLVNALPDFLFEQACSWSFDTDLKGVSSIFELLGALLPLTTKFKLLSKEEM